MNQDEYDDFVDSLSEAAQCLSDALHLATAHKELRALCPERDLQLFRACQAAIQDSLALIRQAP